MLRHRIVLTLVSLLALGGLLGAACGSDDESPTAAPAAPVEPAPAPAPPEAPEPAPTPEPAPAPPEPPEDEPPPTTVADEPPEPEQEPPAAADTTDGADEDPAGTTGDFPATINSDAGTWTLESQPQRIVSLSPTATEILFAIGAGPQVVAVDNWSTYPAEAPTTDLSGFNPNIEAVTAYEPDLVVISNDANDLVAGLTALDIPVLISPSPADIEGGYGAVETLGVATGHASEAEEIVGWMRAEIAAALQDAPEVPIRIYHELDDTHFSVSSNSFIGAVYAALGTTNIADPADADGYGYPQLTEEYIVEADPELIIITDLLAYTAADVAARPGWETITAIRDGNILVVNADIASRWGPRLPQFVSIIVESLTAIAEAGG
ncbi:MAG: ABC transporter substrate-binding protein [Acidimicrobiia bacterium]|nr:ABC transporter substrate-binding protein [Acidimicrobiia bacterium]MYB24490.1 ABC transporter substrate-binding protein [Acidimicrobiia bacterium]